MPSRRPGTPSSKSGVGGRRGRQTELMLELKLKPKLVSMFSFFIANILRLRNNTYKFKCDAPSMLLLHGVLSYSKTSIMLKIFHLIQIQYFMICNLMQLINLFCAARSLVGMVKTDFRL